MGAILDAIWTIFEAIGDKLLNMVVARQRGVTQTADLVALALWERSLKYKPPAPASDLEEVANRVIEYCRGHKMKDDESAVKVLTALGKYVPPVKLPKD